MFQKRLIPYNVISWYRKVLFESFVCEHILSRGKYDLQRAFRLTRLIGFDPSVLCPLSSLLMASGDLKATEPHDYVYRLLGLVDQSTRNKFRIDYSIPVAQLFSDAVPAAFGQDEYGHIFSRVWERYSKTSATVPNLPSWCPDSSSLSSPGIRGYGRFEEVDSHVVGGYEPWARCDFDVENRTMGFAAWYLDTVSRSISETVCVESQVQLQDNSKEDLLSGFLKCFNDHRRRWEQALVSTFPEVCNATEISEDTKEDFWQQLRDFIWTPDSPGFALGVSQWNSRNAAAPAKESSSSKAGQPC